MSHFISPFSSEETDTCILMNFRDLRVNLKRRASERSADRL